MTANIGTIIGPMIGKYRFSHVNALVVDCYLGGLLAEPVTSYPGLFGPRSLIGGENGVQWMIKFPYALPNLVSACFLIGSGLVVILGLEEVQIPTRPRIEWRLTSIRRIICLKAILIMVSNLDVSFSVSSLAESTEVKITPLSP
jgi:hypothetical protein